MANVFEWSTLTCNPSSQAMARAALDGPQDWFERELDGFVENRELIQGRLQGANGISTLLPEGATFFYLNFTDLDVGQEEFCGHLLARYGVPTVPGTSFAGGEQQEGGYLRLPFGGSAATMERAVRGLLAAAEDALGGTIVSAAGLL